MLRHSFLASDAFCQASFKILILDDMMNILHYSRLATTRWVFLLRMRGDGFLQNKQGACVKSPYFYFWWVDITLTFHGAKLCIPSCGDTKRSRSWSEPASARHNLATEGTWGTTPTQNPHCKHKGLRIKWFQTMYSFVVADSWDLPSDSGSIGSLPNVGDTHRKAERISNSHLDLKTSALSFCIHGH